MKRYETYYPAIYAATYLVITTTARGKVTEHVIRGLAAARALCAKVAANRGATSMRRIDDSEPR